VALGLHSCDHDCHADAFHFLLPNATDFTAKRPILIAMRHALSAILCNHATACERTVYISRQYITTTAFLVFKLVML